MKELNQRSGQPLRIGFHSPGLPGSGVSNGIVTYTGIMRDALRALGHSVIIVSGDHIDIDGKTGDLPRAARAIVRAQELLGRRQPNDGSNRSSWLRINGAFLAARRAGAQIFELEETFGWAGALAGRGIPVVERLHGPHAFIRDAVETEDQKARGDRREAAECASLSKVQAVTSPTQRLLDEVVGRCGVQPAIARAIPNPMPVAPRERKWRFPEADPNQILFVGRFDLCKGADIILHAFARAVERKPELKLVMAGPDYGLARADGSTVHFDDFMLSEIPPGARSRIAFLGSVEPERLAELRRQSAVAVLTSRFENFPYSLAEAMAVGMPVLTSATFGGQEMVRDGIDGRVIPIGDPLATAEALSQMLGNPEHLQEMAESGYRRIAEWLSPERIALETASLYQRILDRCTWRRRAQSFRNRAITV